MTVTKSRFKPQPNQLYETEPWATRALLRYIPVAGKRVWEPSAGKHKIVRVLREAGADVIPSDRFYYEGFPSQRFNFLGEADWIHTPVEHDHHIANPPYGPGNRDAHRWAELALERTDGWIALLLTMKFDAGLTRTHLFRDNSRFHAKLTLLDRVQWFASDMGGTEDHAWFVWRPRDAPVEPPTIWYQGRNGNE